MPISDCEVRDPRIRRTRQALQGALRSLMQQGRIILLTTHFIKEAEHLYTHVTIMDHGRIIAAGTPRELIARHIEPQVIEVYGDGAERWALAHGQLAQRCERTGETVFCYAEDADAIVHQLDREKDIRYLHRPANLEDVFLKLTGRDIRD